MNPHADRARSFALYSFGIAMLGIAAAAVLFALSWRQHYGPCPSRSGFGVSRPVSCTAR